MKQGKSSGRGEQGGEGRRGEVPFVAIRVGRSSDPREVLGLARDLRISRATSLGTVALWEEFLLEVGDALTGRVKGYTAHHIAAKLDWPGKPAVLIEALKRAGLLKSQRNVFFHPYWGESITGQYARDRAEQRERWRAQKRAQREADVRAESGGHGADVHADSIRTADIKKERNDGSGAPAPQPPPRAGGESGFARWEWMELNHKRPRDSQRCIRILEAMAPEKWDLCQWVITEDRRGGLSLSLSKKRALKLDSYRFLLNEAYLEFLPERRKKLAAAASPKNGASVETAADKTAASVAFLLAALRDRDLAPDEKERIKARWLEQNPHTPRPWESLEDSGGAHERPQGAHA